MASLSWAFIVNQFEEKYNDVYLGKNVKAHFDYCQDIIDGAKERWRTLLLIDAIVCSLAMITLDDIK
jgi:hypothetical protein